MTARRAGVLARQSRAKVKSVEEQFTECLDDLEEIGATAAGTYTDLVSASRFATRGRLGWPKLLADIQAGQLDVVVCWTVDRADRELESWAGFLNLCRSMRVLIRVTDHQRTYDVSNPHDWKALAEAGIDAAYFSEKLSRSVQRGVRGSARAGRPAMGPAPYGYRRVYDPATGKLAGEYVDDDDGGRRWVGGQEEDPTTAPIVRDIFDRVAKGEPTNRIIAELNARGVPPPGTRSHKKIGSKRWYPQRIRKIVLNPVYLGQRRHRATGRNAIDPPPVFDAGWPALVDERVWYAANRVMSAPHRFLNGRKPGRQTHLLTYLATCHRGHPIRARADIYTCEPGCVHLKREPVDRRVRETMISYLSRPDVHRNLRRVGENADRETHEAEAEAARLQGQLDDWRLSATDGRGTTPETLAVVEAELRRKIKEAQERGRLAGLPPAWRGFLAPGVSVAKQWDSAELSARRDLIRALVKVELYPSGRNHTVPPEDRVRITPVSG